MTPGPQQRPLSARRVAPRIDAQGDVSVYWQCEGRDDVSHIRDLSATGLCIATSRTQPIGAKATLEFLVQEGRIKAVAVVRHMTPGIGLGLKFTAVTEQDCRRLEALMNRLRSLSRSRAKS